MSISDRLKHARNRAGLTGPQVEERADIGRSSLSEFENGKRDPSLSQLQKLADVYRRSVAFFLAEGPIADEPAVLWRLRPNVNAEDTEGQFLRLCEQYHNLEIWCCERVQTSLPQVACDSSQFWYNDAEELAKSVLRELPLGNWPGQSLLNVLEEVCGVKVFHLESEPSGTAASTVSESFGAAVLLNANNVRWRRNFDLAHELFHLLTWKSFHGDSVGTIAGNGQEESFADCFASNLLMPTDPFRTAINARMTDGKITFESLFDISREFDVSIESLMWRLHFVYGRGKSDSERTKKEIEQAKTLMPLFQQDRKDQKPCALPARYQALAVKALRRGEIAIGRFAEYLNISRQDAMQFVEQEVPDREEVQVAPA